MISPIVETPKPRKPKMQLPAYATLKHVLVVVLIVLAVVAFFFLVGISIDGAERFPIEYFIVAAAIAGSLVNQPFRHDEREKASWPWIIAYMLWKIAVSIVFAFVLYGLFMSGIICGDMFPQFAQIEARYEGMPKFYTDVDPQTNKDVAKVLIWSFIAGYSERFVPNIISQILKSTESTETKEED